jgi:hypothetical protein
MAPTGVGGAIEGADRQRVAGDGLGTGRRMHLVTVDPVPGRRAWEHAWCTCGAEGRFRVDGDAEDWALTHTGAPLAVVGWRAAQAS